MGLLSKLGVGGGKLAIHLDTPTTSGGGVITGYVLFKGGKRAQVLDAVRVWLCRTRDYNVATQQVEAGTTIIVPPKEIGTKSMVSPAEEIRFPFEINAPDGLANSAPETIAYAVFAGADIPGELDPQVRCELIIASRLP
jgi:sporulation-control protein spo0M